MTALADASLCHKCERPWEVAVESSVGYQPIGTSDKIIVPPSQGGPNEISRFRLVRLRSSRQRKRERRSNLQGKSQSAEACRRGARQLRKVMQVRCADGLRESGCGQT